MSIEDWALSIYRSMDDIYYTSVKSFDAAGDGVRDDSDAVQRALDANGRVFFPPGEYNLRNIKIDGSNKEVLAPSGVTLKNNFGDGSHLFDIGSVQDVQYFRLNAARITMAANGGDIFHCSGTMNHSQIDVDFIDHNALDASIIWVDDTSFFFNRIRGLSWSISEAHTEPAIRLWSTTNRISANTFDILKPDRSGLRHYMELLCSSTGTYNFSNLIRLSNPEVCAGGVLKISRAFGTVVEYMTLFDTSFTRSTVNHIIHIGTAADICQNTKIRDYQRNDSTLGAGLKDIYVEKGTHTYIEAPTGTNSSSPVLIDLNNQANSVVVGAGYATIENANLPWTAIFDSNNGVSTPHLTLPAQGGSLTIASGVITVTKSVHRIEPEALAATDDLVTINGGTDGDILILRSVSSGRETTLKDGTGNLFLAGDFVLSNFHDSITLRYDALLSGWVELSRSDNGA